MRKIIQSMGKILAIGVTISAASKADEMYPQSFVNVHANASTIGFYDNHGYYNNYEGIYYDYNSSSAQGGGGGAALRFGPSGAHSLVQATVGGQSGTSSIQTFHSIAPCCQTRGFLAIRATVTAATRFR